VAIDIVGVAAEGRFERVGLVDGGAWRCVEEGNSVGVVEFVGFGAVERHVEGGDWSLAVSHGECWVLSEKKLRDGGGRSRSEITVERG
jgi:hypothetical protein